MNPLRNRIKFDAYVKCGTIKRAHNINLDNKDHMIVYSQLKIRVGEMFSGAIVITLRDIDELG